MTSLEVSSLGLKRIPVVNAKHDRSIMMQWVGHLSCNGFCYYDSIHFEAVPFNCLLSERNVLPAKTPFDRIALRTS